MNDTPQGDGNSFDREIFNNKVITRIRMNDTPQGDGNPMLYSFSIPLKIL